MVPTKKELMLAVLVMLALPLLGEVALRVARVQFDAQLYGPDRELGWVLRPRASGIVSVETQQYVQINSHGFHDQERTYEKPANTVRIAVLGNSWTEALQVPQEKNFCSVLERKLAGRACFAGKRVEVLNFGVAGYSTAQELLTLRQEVWKYHPDVVVVALYAARDIANNVRELNNAVDPERSPYFVYHGEELVLDDAFRAVPGLQPWQIVLQNIGYRMNRQLRVLQAINAVQRFGKIRVGMAAAKERAGNSGVENLEYSIYAPPSLPAMQTAWKVTEGLLIAVRDEVKAHGGEFCVVTLATRPQVIPDAAKRAELKGKLGIQDFRYADRVIKEFGDREAIPVITLAPALSAYAEEHQVYLNGFNSAKLGTGHWNETGHRLAGEAIADALCGGMETKDSSLASAAN
jgi:hypothetical protein